MKNLLVKGQPLPLHLHLLVSADLQHDRHQHRHRGLERHALQHAGQPGIGQRHFINNQVAFAP